MGFYRQLGSCIGNCFGIGAAIHVIGNRNRLFAAKTGIGVGSQHVQHIGVLRHQFLAQLEFLYRLDIGF